MVAPGTVKSRMPSALADIDQRSADSFTPLAGSPASTPASLPRSSEPGASSAPASTAPLVSEITRVSARPIRPPAPATIKRISDMAITSSRRISRHGEFRQPIRPPGHGDGGRLPLPFEEVNRAATALFRLRAVIPLDDQEISFGMGLTQRDEADIFGRIIAGDRGVVVLELDHHVAGARGAFLGNVPAAAHQKPSPIFGEHRAVLRDVVLVAFGVVHVDARDPVAFCHVGSPCSNEPEPRFSTLCSDAFSSREPAPTSLENAIAPARSPPGWTLPPPSDRRPPSRDGRPRDSLHRP